MSALPLGLSPPRNRHAQGYLRAACVHCGRACLVPPLHGDAECARCLAPDEDDDTNEGEDA